LLTQRLDTGLCQLRGVEVNDADCLIHCLRR
jgi:hypothetical protein